MTKRDDAAGDVSFAFGSRVQGWLAFPLAALLVPLLAARAAAAERAFSVFTYEVKPARTPQYAPIQAVLFDCKPSNAGACTFSNLAKLLGETFTFPRPVTTIAEECGPQRANMGAYYEGAGHSMHLCYEFADLLLRVFGREASTQSQAQQLATDAYAFTFMHELGHFTIGELGLGVMGKEEDAVDEFATVFLVGAGQPEWAVAGASAMLSLGKLTDQAGGARQYWDTHSFGQQRFFDIMCSVYGSDPKRFSILVPSQIPPDRAGRCPGEYAKHTKAWTELLAPHYRKRGASGLATQRLLRIVVQVQGAANQPVPGAFLTVFKPGVRQGSGPIRAEDTLILGKSGEDGVYYAGVVAGMVPGRYRVKVVRKGYKPYEGDAELVEGAMPGTGVLSLRLVPE